MAAAQSAVSFFRLAGRYQFIWAGNKGRAKTVGLSFRGEFDQKVDSKGRMSIPAAFRRVLEDGDPDFPQNPSSRMVVLYGPHLKGCLHAYTIDAMAEIEADIEALPRGSKRRKYASQMILGKSWETEIDRDGRIVLPKERREQIGLEGVATMAARGDYFEIWNADTYTAEEDADLNEFLAEQDDDFDPLSLLDGAKGA
ncbi:division/cell wall cluster transcriptional repressor MraZ [Thalassovita sp.]|uniref:division/cell wall cluster transcriptional repressor MraZ n=1 Tax=Thalassovita sp. TaxID=1979401 RepID=UPI002B268EBC|nr:division/cell wall cluster transcriptional repressor MraZ [Thalassovita sp.]